MTRYKSGDMRIYASGEVRIDLHCLNGLQPLVLELYIVGSGLFLLKIVDSNDEKTGI